MSLGFLLGITLWTMCTCSLAFVLGAWCGVRGAERYWTSQMLRWDQRQRSGAVRPHDLRAS
jgi:hypothetical protein